MKSGLVHRMAKNEKRAFGIKGIIVVSLALIATIVLSNTHASESDSISTKRLVLTQGRALNVYFEGQYREIKRAEIIYGYGWLDDHRVFVAYQQEGTGEAVAVLEVIDLRHSRTTKLTSFGGVGESHFDVNFATGEVVYADSSGVKLLKIDAKTNSYRVDDIKKNVECYGAFWVDNKTVGCLIFVGSNKTNFVKFPVAR